MNTTENNKKLAIFMGHHLEHPLIDTYEPNGEDFKYDTSWDWLMEVVEKIESLEDTERFEITNSGVNITHYQTKEVKFIYNGYHTNNGMYLMTEKAVDTKIEAVYLACIEFAEWYDKEQIIGREEKTKQLKQNDTDRKWLRLEI